MQTEETADPASVVPRRLPIGAEPTADGAVHFRVWAPARTRVRAVLEGGPVVELRREAGGYFSGVAAGARPGARYRFQLDADEALYPDPASRYQPDGVHGPSQVVDPAAFRWTDDRWRGVTAHGQVLYEMHVGTLTREGTWAAATRQLERLADLGVTCLEVMPVCEFAGAFGWGYDGVDLFAPTRLYGTPDDFRAFVDRAHALGVGVILDVVYNHFGPDGNYLKAFAPDYFTDKYKTDWGEAIHYDGPGCGPVREFFVANARHWIEEYHLDGFRFDATQAIYDESPKHILAEIVEASRRAAGPRSTYYVAENEPQQTRIVRPPERGGYGFDALWNDDYHHSAMVALSGRREGYYHDHRGAAQEFVSAAKWGYLFQGQRYDWQEKRRGTPALDLPPTAFVHFIQNHDQVANSARGHRAAAISGPALYRAITALTLLMPQTPMLFQGEEYAAASPFYYFADHHPELGKLIRKGRAEELSQFPCIATAEMTASLVDPTARETFERCKLDADDRLAGAHAEAHAMHRDLLRLRREEAVFRRVQRRGDIDGAVLGPAGFVLRYFGEGGDDRLVLVNLGTDLKLGVAPEPLLAPPAERLWATQWSSEDVRYGGNGTAALDTEQEGWLLPGRSAVVLRPVPADAGRVERRVVKSGTPRKDRPRQELEMSLEQQT